MPPDLVLLSTLIGPNYPCLELIFMVPKLFEPLKFDCISIFLLVFVKLLQWQYGIHPLLTLRTSPSVVTMYEALILNRNLGFVFFPFPHITLIPVAHNVEL